MSFPLHLVLVSTFLSPLVDTLSAPLVDEAFNSFMEKYEKKYSSDDELKLRRGVFTQTLFDIARINEEGGSFNFTADVNEFADMSSEEFTDRMLCGPSASNNAFNVEEELVLSSDTPVEQLPESVDWETAGAMAPTRDQGKCGCCYAIQAATMAESRFKLKTGMDRVVPLSVQQLVDCSSIDTGNKGCKGGRVENCGFYIHTSGLVKEKVYPYVAKDGECKQDVVDLPVNQCIKKGDIEGWFAIPPMDELAMRTAVAGGPISVRIHASTSRFRNYRFGIITSSECSEGNMNHAISIVGYGKSPEGVEYWKILNSWGPTWGENGYGYIQRNDPKNPAGPCGIMREPDLYPSFRDGLTPGTCLE
ncbi:hypothetical protein FOL47_009928 [Perkinsus chesapeaki]|uniref:Cathepsin L n=1 Tax=Perkinsus chesapeaki TaxID=330153 RepID=A0A7J6L5P6_PERCH|nr:hypothetical protein FOL47_009928 [Perkinsus chesapeaki]